jgi:hypothetical protein
MRGVDFLKQGDAGRVIQIVEVLVSLANRGIGVQRIGMYIAGAGREVRSQNKTCYNKNRVNSKPQSASDGRTLPHGVV